METIKPGVYREKPRNLQIKLGVIGKLRTKAAKMARASDIVQYNAQQDIYALRTQLRIDQNTDKYLP